MKKTFFSFARFNKRLFCFALLYFSFLLSAEFYEPEIFCIYEPDEECVCRENCSCDRIIESFFPHNKHFYFCKNCKSHVQVRFYYEDDQKSTAFQCKCFDDWKEYYSWSVYGDDNKYDYCSSYLPKSWIRTYDDLEFFEYYNVRYKFKNNFGCFLNYREQNKGCDCFLHRRSKLACTISDILYKGICSIPDAYYLPYHIGSLDLPFLEKYWEYTRDGLGHLLYSNCFWYSQYYNSNIQLIDWAGQTSIKTKERFSTTWGKIHYAKDGVHIVPTKPRG
jgi:hypothetical protein